MAKRRDDKQPQRKRDDKQANDDLPIEDIDALEEVEDVEEVEEVEDVAEADEAPAAKSKEPPPKTKLAGQAPQKTKLASKAPQKTQLAGRGSQPTMLGPQEPDEVPAKDKDFAGMPNLSLDHPAEATGDAVEAEIVDDVLEVPLAKPVGGSSALDVGEVQDHETLAEAVGDEDILEDVEDVSEVVEDDELPADAEGADVLSEEPHQVGGSSIVEVTEFAEDADDDAEEVLAVDSARGAGSSVVEVVDVIDDDEDVLVEEPAGGSSVVDISEMVDDDEVLHGDSRKGSSVVSASEIVIDSDVIPSGVEQAAPVSDVKAESASEVVIRSDDVVDEAVPLAEDASEVKASPPPPMADDLFAADFLEMQEEESHGASSIFDQEIITKDQPVHSESMIHKEEAFDEILEEAGTSSEEVLEEPASKEKDGVDSDTVDLGSDPDVNLEQPSGFPIRKKAKAAEVEAAEEVDWDDVGADGSDVKSASDSEQTIAFEPESGAKKIEDEDLVEAEDLISEDDLVDDEESSAVDLGKKAPGLTPHSGVDPVAEALESGVNLDAEHEPASKKKKSAPSDDDISFEDTTDMDAAALSDAVAEDDSETILEEDMLAADEEEAPRPRKKPKVAAEEDAVEFDDEDAAAAFLDDLDEPAPKKKKPVAEEDADDLAASAFLDDDEAAPAKKKKDAEVDADELAASAFLDDDDVPVTKKKSKAVVDEGDEEIAAVEEDEEEPVVKKKKGKKKVVADDDDEDELVGAGAAGKPAAKPKYGRRWLGGMFLMFLLLGGAGAGVWFAKPELIDEAYKFGPTTRSRRRSLPRSILHRSSPDRRWTIKSSTRRSSFSWEWKKHRSTFPPAPKRAGSSI